MSWSDVENALQAAIVTATGFPAASVFWKWQNINQPILPFAVLSLTAPQNVGQDWLDYDTALPWAQATPYAIGARVLNGAGPLTYQATTGGTSAAVGTGPSGTGSAIADGTVVWAYQPPGAEVTVTVRGNREITLSIEIYTDLVTTDGAAVAIAEVIRSSLLRPSIRSLLAAAGVSPFSPESTQFLPAITAAGFRARAVLPIRCYVPAPSVAEYVGFIATLAGAAASTDPGGVVTVTNWTQP